MNRRQITYLIAYDVGDPRRLGRVHRWMKQHAVPIQYSVFIGRFSRAHLAEVQAGLAERIDAGIDDARLYPLPSDPIVQTLGARALPTGILDATTLPLFAPSRHSDR